MAEENSPYFNVQEIQGQARQLNVNEHQRNIEGEPNTSSLQIFPTEPSEANEGTGMDPGGNNHLRPIEMALDHVTRSMEQVNENDNMSRPIITVERSDVEEFVTSEMDRDTSLSERIDEINIAVDALRRVQNNQSRIGRRPRQRRLTAIDLFIAELMMNDESTWEAIRRFRLLKSEP